MHLIKVKLQKKKKNIFKKVVTKVYYYRYCLLTKRFFHCYSNLKRF